MTIKKEKWQLIARRGKRDKMPLLAQGEIGYATDEKSIYVGTGEENIRFLSTADIGDGLTIDTYGVVNVDANFALPSSPTFIHTQILPEQTWVINHNLLDKRPSVTIVDSSGCVVLGDVNYVDATQILVSFSAAFSGNAYLN